MSMRHPMQMAHRPAHILDLLRLCAARTGIAVAMLCVCLSLPTLGFAQEEEEGKEEVAVGKVEESKLQTDAPTLENEKKGTEVIRAEAFVREKKLEDLKMLDQQIQRLKKLLKTTPADYEGRPEFIFNLAELYFEKSKYYQLKAYRTQDECYRLEDAKADQRDIDRCKLRMKDELREASRLRKDSVDEYRKIIESHGDFDNMDEVLFYLGSNYIELDQRGKGLAVYKRLANNYPQSRFIPNVLVAFGDFAFDGDEMGQALKAYDKVTDAYDESSVYGYATYKKAWCYFNLDDKEKALDLFLGTLNYAKAHPKFPNSKPLIKQARRDIVTTYAFVGAASKAIPFFRKITDDDRDEWLRMGERLAVYYSDKGKFDDSMSMYRELIKLNQKSVKVIDYQYEVVRNQTSRNAYDIATLKELVLLMKLVQHADNDGFEDTQEPAMNYKQKKAKVEELEHKWAKRYHREAQQTRNPDLYTKAFNLYRVFLETFSGFSDKDDIYQMTFFYGELLYKVEDYEQAAVHYEKALDIKPEGEYTENIARSAVLAYFKLVTVSEERKDLSEQASELQAEAEGGDEEGEEGAKKTYTPPEPREIPDLYKRLIRACERYQNAYAKSEEKDKYQKIVDVKYTRARVFYENDHMRKAAEAFRDIALRHPDHKLAVISANLHLDALYVMRDLDQMEVAIYNYLGINAEGEQVKEPPIKDEVFIEEITDMVAAIAFKKCTVFDENKQWKQASECFVAFFRRYTDSEYGDDALYNAALDLERMSEIGKAIKVRIYLLRTYADSKHAPITLFNVAANYHALAIYSQAAKFYEFFYKNFPDHEKTEDAVRNASLFRYGLGQYDRAIANYERYLELFDDKKTEAAKAHFQIGKIYELQEKKRDAFDHYKEYLRRWAKHGTHDNRLQARLKLGLFYWGRNGKTNRRRALREFERTIDAYEDLSEEEKKKAVQGRDAAAQAMFMISEDIFEEMAKMKVASRNEKELQKRLKKKLEKAVEAEKSFNRVLAFARPDWTIAAFFRIGDGMQNFANSLRETECPRRLSYDQCEIYKGAIEDYASQAENKAVANYINSLEAAKEAKWFNKYTKEAESRLADLRPREWRKPSELRAEPEYVQSGFMNIDVLKKIEEEDRLEDFEKEDDPEESEEVEEAAEQAPAQAAAE